MGNAFTALADDEFALFYNPAGLAGAENYSFHYATAGLQASQDVIDGYKTSSSAFQRLDSDSVNMLMGKNVYMQGSYSAILQMPNIAVGAIADQQFALRSENPASPSIDFGYQTTNGFQAGYGFSFGRNKRKKLEFRAGFAVKLLNRRGGYQVLPLTTMLGLSKTSLSSVIGNYSRGIGGDVGTQTIWHVSKRVNLMAGLAWTDMGDTSFGESTSYVSSSVSSRSRPDSVPENISLGVAAQLVHRLGKINLTYDIRHLNESDLFAKKSHLGLEVDLPLISLYGGLNQLYVTYGVALKVWFLTLTGYSYAEEQGTYIYQSPERRTGVTLDLKFSL